MYHKIRTTIFAAMTVAIPSFAITTAPHTVLAQEYTTIKVENHGAFLVEVSVYDQVCNGLSGKIVLDKYEQKSISICLNESGYGKVSLSGVFLETGNPIPAVEYALISSGDILKY